MLEFEYVTYKNFQSIGNQAIKAAVGNIGQWAKA